MKVYLDNAATTPMDYEVIEAMIPILRNNFGNPSSVHAFGRSSRAIIEKARKQVARLIHAKPSELFFTAGGTEADNMVLRGAIDDLKITHIITSRIEHHAVLDTAKLMHQKDGVKLSYVNVDNKGFVDISHLKQLLEENKNLKTLVSLMHANNEIGSLLPLKKVGDLCNEYDAYFHSDTVQTMGHYPIDVKELGVHFITCSAHKFHGPKGIGFLYVNENIQLKPLITGGAQERNMRAGTENIHGIVGLAKAMEVAHRDMAEHEKQIKGLKYYMVEQLQQVLPEVEFNGDPLGNSLYTVLNVLFPHSEMDEMFIYNLDIEGIAASGGSACSSGSVVGSHVLKQLGIDMERPSTRFSFSKYTTKEEIDYAVSVIKELFRFNKKEKVKRSIGK
ncbi:MAG: cysteine desulfurase [Flavobacteriales bacterium CG_4_10_14_0_2_um_filter_32_8]|nr:MAG: cysteine desulfurase [Flavobacteriales bacterium CG_4_10_14_0_2_um_filter_32_8]PJB14016.1 MAG: cysteine desulfurase [Flavobacteriales bacterium CG_4_9_14_3_um_filter_32_8]